MNIRNADIDEVIKYIFTTPKGILAADEGGPNIEQRFSQLDIPSNYDTHRRYRQMLFTTPEIEHYLSGVIMVDETIRQSTDDGKNFVDLLIERGIVPGVKVDGGLRPLQNFPGETSPEGLDGLPERCREYRSLGIRFVKWRVAYKISDITPSDQGINASVHTLARYAAIAQEAGLIPIIESEVLYDGDHTIERTEEVVGYTLWKLFQHLDFYRIDRRRMIIKTSQVLAGREYPVQSTPKEVGEATARVLRRNIPAGVSGVVFLSGGQTPHQATQNLQAIANQGKQPWPLTFSYSRALQEPPLEIWHGNDANIEAAQREFQRLLRNNSEATLSAL